PLAVLARPAGRVEPGHLAVLAARAGAGHVDAQVLDDPVQPGGTVAQRRVEVGQVAPGAAERPGDHVVRQGAVADALLRTAPQRGPGLLPEAVDRPGLALLRRQQQLRPALTPAFRLVAHPPSASPLPAGMRRPRITFSFSPASGSTRPARDAP